jgi:translation initiation factor IF-2
MSDNDGKKPLGLGGSRPSNVKQSFSHGRTKNVVVETKRKRVVVPKPAAAKPTGVSPVVNRDPSKRPAGISDVELERRMNALRLAKAREVEEAAAREAHDKERAAEREARRAELEAKEAEDREREERTKAKAAEEERKRVEAVAAKTAAAAPPPAAAAPGETAVTRPSSAPRKTDRERDARNDKTTAKPSRQADDRRGGKLTLNDALRGGAGRHRSMAAMKRKQDRARAKAMDTIGR